MNKNIDIALIKQADGTYDLEIENGDIKGVESFDTAITMSVFCERRADVSEQPINYLRRGWWGNLLNDNEGFELGSKLWEFYQSRASQTVANKIKTVLEEAFAWFVEDGYATNVIVNTEYTGSNINISITIMRSNDVVGSRSFKLWENTGK